MINQVDYNPLRELEDMIVNTINPHPTITSRKLSITHNDPTSITLSVTLLNAAADTIAKYSIKFIYSPSRNGYNAIKVIVIPAAAAISDPRVNNRLLEASNAFIDINKQSILQLSQLELQKLTAAYESKRAIIDSHIHDLQ